jgi:hypothetical protein
MPEPEELEALAKFETENAAAIAADAGKAFELTGATTEEIGAAGVLPAAGVVPEAAAAAAPATEAVPEAKERISALQKIAKMTVGERVKLAMTGSKEDRYILIRDGSRIVSSAVLASPKISDQEIETIAAMKNVQESVLRDIARNRKFMKSYSVLKALVNNPRCPLDISLTLMKNLLTPDLKFLGLNKNVPETLKKVAMKNYKEKSSPGGGKG